jgi:hypothetical protein
MSIEVLPNGCLTVKGNIDEYIEFQKSSLTKKNTLELFLAFTLWSKSGWRTFTSITMQEKALSTLSMLTRRLRTFTNMETWPTICEMNLNRLVKMNMKE